MQTRDFIIMNYHGKVWIKAHSVPRGSPESKSVRWEQRAGLEKELEGLAA